MTLTRLWGTLLSWLCQHHEMRYGRSVVVVAIATGSILTGCSAGSGGPFISGNGTASFRLASQGAPGESPANTARVFNGRFDGHNLRAMATESPTIILRTGSLASYTSQSEFQFKGQFDGQDFTVKATVDNPSAPVIQLTGTYGNLDVMGTVNLIARTGTSSHPLTLTVGPWFVTGLLRQTKTGSATNYSASFVINSG